PVVYPAWLVSAAEAIRALADRPGTLFLLLLAMNAVARPCSATSHDARLYSLQAMNQAQDGVFADDVFLRYGSQDQFTLFAHVIGPLVGLVGVRPAFFGLYLVFNTLFIYSLFRLIRALVDDSLIATISLFYLVTAPLNYGGADIFTVHEQFFTPRLIGTTLTLFALERLLRHGFVSAFALLAAGALFHPLMVFGGMMIWAGYVASTFLPLRVFFTIAIASLLGFTMVLSIPTVGACLFGTLDDDWHRLIRVAVGYNYPDTWAVKDWTNVAVSFAVPTAACLSLYPDDADRQRFFAIAILAGVVGLLTTVAASMLPYALLFQGQPYRVLWILRVVQVPLAFLLIARWSESESVLKQCASLALVGFFCVTHYIPIELGIFAIMVPLSIFASRMNDESWWYGGARGFVVAAIAWMLYRWCFFAAQRDVIARFFDLGEWVMFDLVGPAFLIVGLCVTACYWNAAPSLAGLRWTSALIALGIPLGLFATEVSPAFRQHHTRLGSDIAFVSDFIRDHHPADGRRPAVYCVCNRPDLLWIDGRTTSYFSIIQTAGVMFHRDTAMEIDRRAQVVAKFEMAQQRAEMLYPDEGKKVGMANLFKIDFDCPAPTRDDLIRLCRDPGLDYVAIPHEFPGLHSASNGRIFVYECYKVRTAATLAFSARMAPSER
ncbi:MAG: hypothetical protein HYR84_15405, partial [Planctomycetes bacterium]|nr:hypothetical protein [Planctomycetota bacterium]